VNALKRAGCAGAAAFALVFIAGFAFGTVRTLFTAPHPGEARAVLLGLPAMLLVSWIVVRQAVSRWQVGASVRERFAMGAAAFALLMLAELWLASALSGQSAGAWVAALHRPAGVYGLLGQIAFAAMPLVQAIARRDLRSRRD